MASVRKSGGSGVAPASKSTKVVPVQPTLSLPSERSTPRDSLGAYTWLIYGEKKIGKTSLAAQFPEALFMMFEPGGKGLSIYQREVNDWLQFKNYIKLLKQTDQFQTVIIDTVDISYDKCMTYVGQREGFSHPSDMNDFGKSWQLVAKEFASTVFDLVNTGRGVMFLSHAKEAEFQTQSGLTYNKLVPSMSGQVRNFIQGFVDIIAYYGYYGDERLLTLQGSDSVDAGHRLESRFLVKGQDEVLNQGGEPIRVHSIPMGYSATQGYKNILTAFNNEQLETYQPQRDTALSEAPAKRKGRK